MWEKDFRERKLEESSHWPPYIIIEAAFYFRESVIRAICRLRRGTFQVYLFELSKFLFRASNK